jgi:asparagine synthase (glutamine-hydrolysing)
MRRFWGAYVLIQPSPEGALTLLRDPSGPVPVFHRYSGGLHLAASGPGLMQLACSEPFRPDLHFLRHWLTYPFLRTERTGAEGVRELLPGTLIRSRLERELLWSPWDHVGQAGRIDLEEATRRLREEMLRSIPAMVPDERGVVVQLSGGLDSSIIASALASAGRRFTAVTFATRSPDGDERRYAREVASRFGIELIELVEQEDVPDFTAVPELAFRPPQTALLQPFEKLVADELRRSGARWVVNGAGGDNLFASLNSAAPAVDALRADGLRSAGAALADLSAIHDASRWHVLRLAWRRAYRHQRTAWRREERFLKPGAALGSIDAHPWLPAPARALPGKREHVLSLIGIQHFLDQGQSSAAGLFPLLSQPLLELCLTIPTQLWIHGGRDRAVARAAVSGLVPESVLARRGKGRLESMFMTGYMASRGQLEALLREGELCALGMVDGEAVSAYLREPGQPRDSGYTRLLELAAAESWLRSIRE